MNDLLKRWQALAVREQWLVFTVGLAVLGMLYVTLVGDRLGQRIAALESQRALAETRAREARAATAELQARLAVDPDANIRQALGQARAREAALLAGIDRTTRALVSPAAMKRLLQDLLRERPGLALVSLESFSEPLELPDAQQATAAAENAAAVPTLYRHGLRMTLEGGYFDLVEYLEAIGESGWRLHWDRLDYQVGEGGPQRARIRLELHTLSREEGWVGV